MRPICHPCQRFFRPHKNGFNFVEGNPRTEGAAPETAAERDHLREVNRELVAAIEAAMLCGMIPTSSVSDGGANLHSEQVRVADRFAPPSPKRRKPHEMTDLFFHALARRSDPTTSHDAAAKVNVKETAMRVLAAIKTAPNGLTATEIAREINVERDTVSPRLPELVRAGLVLDSGLTRIPPGRRRKAIVWVFNIKDGGVL